MKVIEILANGFIYLVGGTLAFAFMSDMVMVVGSLLEIAFSSVENIIAMLLTLGIMGYWKKDSIYSFVIGAKTKVEKLVK